MERGSILAMVPKDRTRLGRVLVISPQLDGLTAVNGYYMESKPVAFVCPAYFKADNAKAAAMGNPDRDPLKRYGDHPTGLYRVKIGRSNPKFGPHPLLSLVPVEWSYDMGGDAWWAKDGGRFGIACHGGRLNDAGELRPTYGCVRVHDDDQGHLVRLVAELNINRWLSLEDWRA